MSSTQQRSGALVPMTEVSGISRREKGRERNRGGKVGISGGQCAGVYDHWHCAHEFVSRDDDDDDDDDTGFRRADVPSLSFWLGAGGAWNNVLKSLVVGVFLIFCCVAFYFNLS